MARCADVLSASSCMHTRPSVPVISRACSSRINVHARTCSAHLPRPAQLSSQPCAAQPCAPCVLRATRLPAPRFGFGCCTGLRLPNPRLPCPCAGGLSQVLAPRPALQLSARQRQPGPGLRSQRQLTAFSASVRQFSESPVSCVGFRASSRCALLIFASAFPYSLALNTMSAWIRDVRVRESMLFGAAMADSTNGSVSL